MLRKHPNHPIHIMTTKKVILSKPADWDSWIAFVRTRADALDIWEYINPDLEAKPDHLIKQVAPIFTLPPEGEALDKDAYELHKIKLANHKQLTNEYEKQRKAFSEIVVFIQETISTANATYIEDSGSHPYDILIELKKTLAPTDEARELALETEYRKLCKGPKNQDIKKWLEDWTRTYKKAKQYGIGEISGTRPVRDFLLAVKPLNHPFATYYLMALARKDKPEIHNVIEEFRHTIRLELETKETKGSSHSAFSSDESESAAEKPSFRGKPIPTPRCICTKVEWFSDCYYLNPDKRPAGWKPDPEIQKKVTNALKNEEFKARIDRALKKSKEIDDRKKNSGGEPNSESETHKSNTDKEIDGVFPVIKSNFSTHTFALQSSWILDHGSSTHVCNSSMKHRFIKDREGNGQNLIAGTQILPIEAYGHIDIRYQAEGRIGKITLTNVSYVSQFMTNIVSGVILHTKGLDFDTQGCRLHKNGKTFGYANIKHGHFIMEDNIEEEAVFSTTTTKSGSANDWHKILGHASNDVILNLEKSVDSARITGDANAPTTSECESCALAKMHRQISRSSEKSESSDKPFYRVTYDLMQFSPGLNKDQWVSHLACSELDFNLVFTHPHKSDATEIIRKGLNIIRTRFNSKVVFFRSDGERALGKEFDDMISELGITYEPSAPYTPEQNGHSERKGGLLAMKARAMRIEAKLPMYLWPWIIRAAGFIMNRTPIKKHGWKTPFELITHTKPNLSHLRKFGSKAYPLDKQIPKKNKLQERAHIGFLLGYDGTNIYNIWIPSQRKVIRTRDVIFDESAYYNPSEIDLAQILTESMTETTYELPTLLSQRIVEIDSESEEEEEEQITEEGKNITDPNRSEQSKQTEPNIPIEPYTNTHLPSPEQSEENFNSNPDPAPNPPSSTKLPKFAPTPKAPKDIQGNVEESNILPEGEGRIRKKRQAHVVALEQATSGNANIYHTSFSCFIAAKHYYLDQEIVSSNDQESLDGIQHSMIIDAKNLKPITTANKYHRDNMPLSPLITDRC